MSLGVLAQALAVLGERQRLGELMDMGTNDTGLMADLQRLPQRVRHPKRRGAGVPPGLPRTDAAGAGAGAGLAAVEGDAGGEGGAGRARGSKTREQADGGEPDGYGVHPEGTAL